MVECARVCVLMHRDEMTVLRVLNQHGPQLQQSLLPLGKHFQMLPPCCRTVRGNARQAKRKSRRDGGDLLQDKGCSKRMV